MLFLNPKKYDLLEKKAIKLLPIPVLMAFKPKVFSDHGYPVKITSKLELTKFVDHNFEPLIDNIFKKDGFIENICYENRFTDKEANLFSSIQNLVGSFTKLKYKKSIKPLGNLLVQLGPLRVLNQINENFKKKINLFEFGPGHGYLGALVSKLGFTYASYDVTQSLYLWQNHLYSSLFGKNFNDLINKKNIIFHERKITHLTWWQFYDIFSNCKDFDFDVIYSNSNLSEMNPNSLKINLIQAKRFLKKSKIGIFFFFSTGYPGFNNSENILIEMRKFGFKEVFTKPFFCYTLKDENVKVIKEIFKNGIIPVGNKENFKFANEFMVKDSDSLPLDYNLTNKFFMQNYYDE